MLVSKGFIRDTSEENLVSGKEVPTSNRYFYGMIKEAELRLGNYLLQKVHARIQVVQCAYQHFAQLEQGRKDLFPIVLNEANLNKAGFQENKKYPLLPGAHEYILLLPIQGSGQNEIRAYIKTNKECFARAMMNNVPVSNPIYYLHQLQNLFYDLTGEELMIHL